MILFVIAFKFENYPIGMIASLSFITLGVSVLIYGMEGITNTLTLYVGNILWALGVIILINGNIEYIEDVI